MSSRAAGSCAVVFLAVAVGTSRATEWTAGETEKGYVVFEHNTLARMPSEYVPDREKITDRLSCALAQGEYESVQFGVHAVAGELKDIRVTATSDLEVRTYRRRAEHTVPAAPEATAADLDKRVASPSEWMYLEKGSVVERLPAGVSVNFWLTVRARTGFPPSP